MPNEGNTMTESRGKREDTRVCIHEAAHLVACYRLGLSTPHGATVEPGKGHDGIVTDPALLIGPEWKRTFLRDNPENAATFRKADEMKVVFLLAGWAAELRRRGAGLSGSSIIISSRLDEVSETDADFRNALAVLEIYEPDAVKRNKWLFDLWERTFRLVGEWRDEIRRVASFLAERRTLDRDGIFEAYELIEAKEV